MSINSLFCSGRIIVILQRLNHASVFTKSTVPVGSGEGSGVGQDLLISALKAYMETSAFCTNALFLGSCDAIK